MAFTIDIGKAGGTAAEISAPGFNEGNKGDYKAALDAIVAGDQQSRGPEKTEDRQG